MQEIGGTNSTQKHTYGFQVMLEKRKPILLAYRSDFLGYARNLEIQVKTTETNLPCLLQYCFQVSGHLQTLGEEGQQALILLCFYQLHYVLQTKEARFREDTKFSNIFFPT